MSSPLFMSEVHPTVIEARFLCPNFNSNQQIDEKSPFAEPDAITAPFGDMKEP